MSSRPIMATYDQVILWIGQKTSELKGKKYPRNFVHVTSSLREIRELEREVQNWQTKVDGLALRTLDIDKKAKLISEFDFLKEFIEKLKHCLETMQNVSQLEESVVKLSNNFDKSSTQLCQETNNKHESCNNNNNNVAGFIASSAQDCIFGLRDNWAWVAECVRCSSIHLKNAADYHKFFHEVEESERWLDSDLKNFRETFEKNVVDGKPGDADQIVKEINEVNTSLKQWEARVTRLWNESTKLLPVPIRVTPICTPHPGRMLADYETNEVSVRDQEEILLLDNTNPDKWRVRNGKGQEGFVPPVIVIVSGSDQKCIDAADKLRLHLLATWTNLLKRVGVRLICYTIAVFQPDYTQKEINALKSMDDVEKDRLLRILTDVEDALKKYWGDHEGFVNMQERISALRLILEEFGDERPDDYAKICKDLMVKITALGQIIDIYQHLNKDWEKFKVSVEASRSPELMMIVDKWEQLQFVSRDYFSKFWKMKLPLDEQEKRLMNARTYTIDGVQFEDTIHMGPINSPRPQSAHISTVQKFHFSTPQIKLTSLDDKIQFNIGVPYHSPDNQTNESHVTSATIMAKTSFPTIRFTVDLHAQGSPDKLTREDGFDETRVVIESPKRNGSDAGSSDHGFSETKVFETRFGTKNAHTAQLSDAVDNLFHHMSTGINDSGYSKGHIRDTKAATGGELATSGITKTGLSFNVTDNLRSVSPSQVVEEFGFDETRTVSRQHNLSDDSNDSTFTSSRPQNYAGTGSIGSFGQVEKWSSGDEEVYSMTRASGRASGSDYEGTAFGIATETKTAETEQLSSAEMEENKTFVIGSVLNSMDGSEISLQQAILLGVIKPSEGVYVDLKNNARIPIATAMSDGMIRVVHCRTKRSQEKFSSVGIITIKTVKELLRPYSVFWVKDTKTQEEVDPREAIQRGILDEKQGYFIDKNTGATMMLVDASKKGLAKIEYSDHGVPAPEVVVKTYAVRAVVDRRLKKTITFHDAVKRGIIDKESGAFRDTVTGEKMYVGDAIMRGFLKARLIEDASGLNIDPRNQMVIDKTQKIKNKILKPLQIISAFKAGIKRPGSASSEDKSQKN